MSAATEVLVGSDVQSAPLSQSFEGFLAIATRAAKLGIPVFPVTPGQKFPACFSNFEDLATTDLATIQSWSQQFPTANVGGLARPDGFLFLDEDNVEAIHALYKQQTGEEFPCTRTTESRPGHRQSAWKQTAKTRELLKNTAQIKTKDKMMSVRASNYYVLLDGSIHPDTGLPYVLVDDSPIVPMPDKLVDFILSIIVDEKTTPVRDLTQPITKGGRNDTLTSIAGTLRQKGLPPATIEQALLGINSQCDPPLDASEVHTIAFSIGRYAVVPEKKFTIGGQDPTVPPAVSTAPVQVTPTVEPVAMKKPPYPVFPDWVMNGTSIYEGLVKPVCDVNSRYPEFMFMPALLMLMNYIGGRVRIAENFTIDGQLVKRDLITSLFLVMIGRKGRVIKSSSAKDAVNYFKVANMSDWASPQMKTGNSKSIVWSAGSPEGLGLDMARLACNNGVLFYDELTRLTKKAGIESSTLQDALLTLYESDFFANQTKRKSEAYSLPPGSYCSSLIACTTDKNFHTHWSKLAGDSSGLDERFFFLYQPSVFKDMVPRVTVNTTAGAAITRQRVDVALNQGLYRIVDSSPFAAAINELGNRSEIRAEKFALAFAVDLGRDEIDEDCVERGLALSKYEISAKNWLKTFESTTREGDLQQQILHKLRQEGGVITVRKLENDLRAASHGTSLWGQAFRGLIQNGWTATRGSGKRGSPFELVLIREPDYEEAADATD